MRIYSIKTLKYLSFFSLMNNSQITYSISYKERRAANSIHGKGLAFLFKRRSQLLCIIFSDLISHVITDSQPSSGKI